MKITSISYKKIFPGQIAFTNVTLGVEIQIDEDYDTPEEGFDLAKKTVEDWHKKDVVNNLVLNDEHFEGVEAQGAGYNSFYGRMKLPPELKSVFPEVNIQYEKMEIQIDNCKSVEELALLKKNLPNSLMPNYMKRMKELTPKTVM